MINSVISAYYYLRIAKAIWIDEPTGEEKVTLSFGPGLALLLTSLAIILLGVAPALITKATEFGAHLFLP